MTKQDADVIVESIVSRLSHEDAVTLLRDALKRTEREDNWF